MYNGIKRKRKKIKAFKMPTKVQIVTLEQVEYNGFLTEEYVVKTHDFSADPNIRYQDFEVCNLQRSGVDVQAQPAVTMTPSKEKVMKSAETANGIMEQYEIIAELEKQRANEQPTKQEEAVQ